MSPWRAACTSLTLSHVVLLWTRLDVLLPHGRSAELWLVHFFEKGHFMCRNSFMSWCLQLTGQSEEAGFMFISDQGQPDDVISRLRPISIAAVSPALWLVLMLTADEVLVVLNFFFSWGQMWNTSGSVARHRSVWLLIIGYWLGTFLWCTWTQSICLKLSTWIRSACLIRLLWNSS